MSSDESTDYCDSCCCWVYLHARKDAKQSHQSTNVRDTGGENGGAGSKEQNDRTKRIKREKMIMFSGK
jgi:K+-transporting ATPase c subunit